MLETREIEPLGTNERRRLDLRVVAATKVDLGDPQARGCFREDLYYRLNVITLTIPPLRERRADIPILFGHFLRRAAERFGRPMPEMTAEIMARLERDRWSGNVRELMHFAERVALGMLSPPTLRRRRLNCRSICPARCPRRSTATKRS